MSKVDHPQKAVAAECTHFMSRKCLCELPACSQDANYLRETVASRERYYQSPQLQEGVNVIHARDSSCASVSSCEQCTCSTESQLLSGGSLSATHRNACACRRGSKPPENLVHFVRHGQTLNDVRTDLNYTKHCCTCVRDPGMPSCYRGVMLTNVTGSLCPHCTKFAQVNRPEERDSRLTSRHSETDLYSTQEERERTISNPKHLQTVDVREWQRRHIEHLDRQKLEVCHTCLQVKFFDRKSECFCGNTFLQ